MKNYKRIGLAFIALAMALITLALTVNSIFYYSAFIFLITGVVFVFRESGKG